jgi:hypothetical protein
MEEEKAEVEEKKTRSPYARAHVWTAWWGTARAAGQRLPG